MWTDNHSWVLPKGGTNAETRKAALVFLKFLWDHNFDWARGGGHLPARQSVMAEYAKLPLRQYVVRYLRNSAGRCRTKCTASSASRT